VVIERKALIPVDFESENTMENQGFIVDEFHIATAKLEVFQSPSTFTVTFANGEKIPAYVKHWDPHNELLILRLENSIKVHLASSALIA